MTTAIQRNRKTEIIISVQFDEREKDWFAVYEDGSGESWVLEGARNWKDACEMVRRNYPHADIRLA